MVKNSIPHWIVSAPIAHRGYFNAEIPENSLPAFKLAVENKFNVELDIQLSKDDQIVVFHDNDLKRVCGLEKNVRELTYEELQKLSLKGTKYKIPLFSEVLEVINGQVGIVVELKSMKDKNERLIELAIPMLREYKGDFVVQSFDPFLVKPFIKMAPEFVRGQLVFDMKGSKMPKITRIAVSRLWTNIFSRPVYINTYLYHMPPKVKRWLKRGKPVISYTAKNPDEYVKCLKIYDNVIFEGFDPRPYFENK